MFKLKQTLLATAATAALLGPTVTFAIDAGTGTITFSGSVTEAPCSILPGDSNLVVDLGQISKKSLTGAIGKASLSVPVNIHLSGCSFDTDASPTSPNPQGLLSKVGVTFSGGIAAGTNGNIVNTGTADSGIAIQLLHSDNTTAVNFTTSGTKAGVTQQMMNGGTNNMVSLFARLVATKATVVSGPVAGQVTYTLAYF